MNYTKNRSLFYPFIPKEDIMEELEDTLSGRWIGQAHKVEEFEKRFAEMFGYKYVLFTNSCTSALELTYQLLDLGVDDEVIVPVADCTAGQMGLMRRGVKIVFSDVDNNLNLKLDPKQITKKTKAIIAVNLGGIEVDDSVHYIAKKHKIPVITDSAQHLGNSKGDYICYSFQAIKHITTGDGGMLVLRNKKEYERAKKLRWFGIDRDLKAKKDWQAWEKREMTFDIEEPGFKYQPTDVAACFGLAGLKHASSVILHRQMLVQEYKDRLKCDTIAGGTCWLMGILVDNRDEVAKYLKDNGIETNLVHLRNDIFTVFGGKRLNLPNMNRLESKYLYLPLHNSMTAEDVYFISDKVNECIKNQK